MESVKAAVSETLRGEAPGVLGDNSSKTSTEEKKSAKKKVIIKALMAGERVITEASDEARELYNQSRFGSISDSGKI